MNRADYIDLIQRDLDGELSLVEKEMLERKLQIDPELQLVHSRLSRVSDSLEQLPKVTPPFSLVDSILPQLEMDLPSPEPAAAKAQPSIVKLPRLEKKGIAASVESSKYKLPAWLVKVSSGVVAACLMFGMYTMAHKAILSDQHDNRNGNGDVQQVNVTKEPPSKQDPVEEQTPTGKETTETPDPDTTQTKPPETPDQSAVVKENPQNPSWSNQYRKVDDKDKGKDKNKDKDKGEDKDKGQGNSKIKDPKTGKAVPPNDDKKSASENAKNQGSNGKNANSVGTNESEKGNGKNKDKEKDNGKDKDKNNGKDKDKEIDDDEAEVDE
ncbi:anti-sigma factor family protein [Brevibacillus sp. SYSU BS000544]|uniref:anti-sigma factor family protein n=1 Tax=Brevibacillus sp. SYSU BS000544 TaxID=3416443 RepID=UPI003CE4A554